MQLKRASLIHRWVRRITPFIAIAVFFASTIVSAQAVPVGELLFRGIQILQISNLSERQEVQVGAQMHQNLLNKGTKLSTDAALNRNVTEIGQRLGAQSRRSIPFRYYVVQDKSINAFATMGGYVYVTTGLLGAADNEAQLASVMGHEMGHIEKRHLITQIQNTMITRGLLATALGLDQNQLATIGIELLVNRPQSREDEYQADQVGLRMLRDADYATSAMPTFMQKLLRRGGGGPTILSTHPAVPDRMKALEKAIQAGPANRCDSNNPSPAGRCGLDHAAYQAKMKQRLAP